MQNKDPINVFTVNPEFRERKEGMDKLQREGRKIPEEKKKRNEMP